MCLQNPFSTFLLDYRFLPTGDKTAVFEDPGSYSPSFLFGNFVGDFGNDFIGVWYFWEGSWCLRGSWEVTFEISGQFSKLKWVGIAGDVFFNSEKIFKWAQRIFLIDFFENGLFNDGLNFATFRFFEGSTSPVVIHELVVNMMRHKLILLLA